MGYESLIRGFEALISGFGFGDVQKATAADIHALWQKEGNTIEMHGADHADREYDHTNEFLDDNAPQVPYFTFEYNHPQYGLTGISVNESTAEYHNQYLPRYTVLGAGPVREFSNPNDFVPGSVYIPRKYRTYNHGSPIEKEALIRVDQGNTIVVFEEHLGQWIVMQEPGETGNLGMMMLQEIQERHLEIFAKVKNYFAGIGKNIGLQGYQGGVLRPTLPPKGNTSQGGGE